MSSGNQTVVESADGLTLDQPTRTFGKTIISRGVDARHRWEHHMSDSLVAEESRAHYSQELTTRDAEFGHQPRKPKAK